MKKKVLFAAGAMIIAAAVSAAVCLNIGQTRHNDLFEQNLDALAQGEIIVGPLCMVAPDRACTSLGVVYREHYGEVR